MHIRILSKTFPRNPSKKPTMSEIKLISNRKTYRRRRNPKKKKKRSTRLKFSINSRITLFSLINIKNIRKQGQSNHALGCHKKTSHC